MNLEELKTHFRSCELAYDQAKEALKSAEMDLAEAEKKLGDVMASTGQRSFKDRHGQTFTLGAQVMAVKGTGVTTEAMLEALRASKLEDLIFESYSASALGSWVKEQAEQKGHAVDPLKAIPDEVWVKEILPITLSPAIRIFQKRSISVRNRNDAAERAGGSSTVSRPPTVAEIVKNVEREVAKAVGGAEEAQENKA